MSKNFNEKITEQIFIDNTEQELNKIIQEIFPWMQKNAGVSNYTECFDELIRLQAKDRNKTQSNLFQAKTANVTNFTSTKSDKLQSNDIKSNINNGQQVISDEIVQYKQTINSLRTEMVEYKTQIDSMQNEIMLFQQVTRSLRVEISRLVNNLTSMILKQDDT